MNANVAALPAFAEADERAFDRAVRRLPGFWTWDYVRDHQGWPEAIISPPWNQDHEAFHVSKAPDEPYNLHIMISLRADEGVREYSDFDQMLRDIRAVVMGDPLGADKAKSDAKPQAPERTTAKGRNTTNDLNGLTAADREEIEETIYDWHEEGYCAFGDSFGGLIFMEWDKRSPAFIIDRLDGGIVVEDRITWGRRNVSGTFSSVGAALEVVRAVISGRWNEGKSEEVTAFLASKSQVEMPGGTMTRARFDAQFKDA